MIKHFKNQNGFSLAQGIILSGILAVSALMATKMLQEQKKIQKSIETRDQIEELHGLIYTTLENRLNCQATVNMAGAASSLIAGANPSVSEVYVYYPTTSTYSVLFCGYSSSDASCPSYDKKTYMNGNVQIKQMQFNYAPSGTGTGTLKITYERLQASDPTKRTKDGYGAKTVTKNITLRVQRNAFKPGKPFESCYAVTNDNTATTATSAETGNKDLTKTMCLEMNGNMAGDGSVTGKKMFVWDEATSTCIPNAQCPFGKIYTGIQADGTVICQDATSFDYNSMLDATTTSCPAGSYAYFSVDTTTNKVKITCTGGSGATDCVGAWSTCSASCGGGSQTYTIITPASGGGAACPYTNGATQTCNTQSCSGSNVDCVGGWGTCTGACSSGTQTYAITTPAEGSGAACEAADGATQGCTPDGCPINCSGYWECVSNTETYNITSPAQNGGSPCPFNQGDTRPCVSCTPSGGVIESGYTGCHPAGPGNDYACGQGYNSGCCTGMTTYMCHTSENPACAPGSWMETEVICK